MRLRSLLALMLVCAFLSLSAASRLSSVDRDSCQSVIALVGVSQLAGDFEKNPDGSVGISTGRVSIGFMTPKSRTHPVAVWQANNRTVLGSLTSLPESR